jgi:hypothetical protein
VLDSPNSQYEISWQPNEIIKDVYIGDFKLDVKQETKCKALLIENQEWGAILIALDSKGFCQFPHYQEIPDIWVTTPLQESKKLVFAINGPFQIDVGRGRLASDSEDNRNVAKELGIFIGQKLCELFEQQSDFNLHEKLGLAVDISDYEFWDSVWYIFAESWLDNDNPFIMNMLGNFNTVGQLINKHPAFPTGLWGNYQVLTHFDKIPTLQSLVTKDKENREQLNIKRSQKATNKKIGENVESVIRKIVRDKGLDIDIEENSVPEDLENFIKANSYVVKDLYEKLGQLPNPNEIKPDIHGYWLKKPLWENNEDIVKWLENEF